MSSERRPRVRECRRDGGRGVERWWRSNSEQLQVSGVNTDASGKRGDGEVKGLKRFSGTMNVAGKVTRMLTASSSCIRRSEPGAPDCFE